MQTSAKKKCKKKVASEYICIYYTRGNYAKPSSALQSSLYATHKSMPKRKRSSISVVQTSRKTVNKVSFVLQFAIFLPHYAQHTQAHAFLYAYIKIYAILLFGFFRFFIILLTGSQLSTMMVNKNIFSTPICSGQPQPMTTMQCASCGRQRRKEKW